MSKAIENLMDAQRYAMSNRPKVGGFPFLAETLRLAGVTRNVWSLPACQSFFHTTYGTVVMPGVPLVSEISDIPKFSEADLVRAIRRDQAGESTFPEFLKSTWEAGVVSYEVDFEKRRVTYIGVLGETYVEDYPQVEVRR
ncbi:MAG: DUF1398 family protein [Deltaproteobacteria bacterium]|nr:DUF1398 family protein [Deltaproteobacteria bacterium]